MRYGNLPGDGNFLSLSRTEKEALLTDAPNLAKLVIPLYGAQEFIRGLQRFCLWIDNEHLDEALKNSFVKSRIESVRKVRIESRDKSYNDLAARPHQFRDRHLANCTTILAPTVSSDTREYLPTVFFGGRTGTTNQAYALYDAPIWSLALLTSKLHLAWIATVCGKLETRYRYSNRIGWNTFPVPQLTSLNKLELSQCAKEILVARESNFPATIKDLYDPKNMPSALRAAHERNDETLERIYIGRRFKNDTERLEKLFEMYTKMTEKN